MPGCLAPQGCIDEAGRDFSRWVTKTLPGLQPLTHNESYLYKSLKAYVLILDNSGFKGFEAPLSYFLLLKVIVYLIITAFSYLYFVTAYSKRVKTLLS